MKTFIHFTILFGMLLGFFACANSKVQNPYATENELRENEKATMYRAVIDQNLQGFATCHFQDLQILNRPKGRIDTQFTVSKTGRVQEATIKSSNMSGLPVEQCVIDKLLSLTFPGQEQTTVVTHRFIFNSKKP